MLVPILAVFLGGCDAAAGADLDTDTGEPDAGTGEGGMGPDSGPDMVACQTWHVPPRRTQALELDVPATADTGDVLTLKVVSTGAASLDDYDYSWFVDKDAPELVGASVVVSYAEPSRYRIQVQATRKDDPTDSLLLVGYVTVARPFADTVFALADEDPPQDVKAWGTPGSGAWCAYYYDVYYGKYTEFWLQQGVDVERATVAHALAVSDFFYERYAEYFGWDYRALPSMRYTLCNDIVGGGAGVEGMFVSDHYTPPGGDLLQGTLAAMAHEYIHTWDFRANSFAQGPDSAHVLTDAFERILLGSFDWAFLGEYDDALMWVDPWFFERYRSNYNLKRYLGDPELDWDTYFSDELMSLSPSELWNTVGFPERQERMYVQAGFLNAVRDMHGDEAMQRFFLEIDRILAADPEWNVGIGGVDWSGARRLENFVTALADALELDVAPYFDYWKVPLTEELRAYTAQYPASPMLDDQDGDGYSPLHGDLDDCDATMYPGAPELADGKDNNQEGLVDEHVYDEAVLGDIEVLDIELPALVIGEISDKIEFDQLRFTVPAGKRLLVAIHPLDAPEPAPLLPGGTQLVSVYAGTVRIGGWAEPSITDWTSGEGRTIVYQPSDGRRMTVSLDAWDLPWANGVPGKYELQLVVEGYTPARWDLEAVVDQLYP